MPRCALAQWKPLLVMEHAVREDAVIVALLESGNAELVLALNNHPDDCTSIVFAHSAHNLMNKRAAIDAQAAR